MRAKHLPSNGPWTYRVMPPRKGIHRRYTIKDPKGKLVGYAADQRLLGEARANVLLMCAAPDLLRALERLLTDVESWNKARCFELSMPYLPTEGETMARAALAKAKG